MNKRSGEETRQRILAASKQVFAEHGYAGANMRLIAQAAGVSVGCVYLYFPRKDDLYLTLMESWMDELNARTVQALRDIHVPPHAMEAFIEITMDYARENREHISVQGRGPGISFGMEVRQAFFRQRRRILEDIINEGIATGHFRDCDAAEAARVIFNTLRGYVFSIVIDEEGLFAPKACTDLVLNGLKRR